MFETCDACVITSVFSPVILLFRDQLKKKKKEKKEKKLKSSEKS